jgi:hypothetical protein
VPPFVSSSDAAVWRSRAERAEAALGGPAEAELVEIFEIEIDESDGAPDMPASTETPVAVAADAAGPGDAEDPGAVLEDDVAAVLAEGEELEAHAAAASDDETNGGTPGGPVPHQG